MKELPEDIKNIKPISSPDDCFNIVTYSTNNSLLDRVDKYKLNLAKSYFMENLDLFSTNQVSDILINPYFKRFDGDFFKKALQYSIKNKWIFPITFKAWLSKETSGYDLERYLVILNQSDDEEQIKFFCQNLGVLAVSSIFTSHQPSHIFSLHAQIQDPKYIFYNKTWNKKELTDWFTQNQDKIEYLQQNYFKTKTIISPNVEEIYSNFLSDFVIENEKNTANIFWQRPFIQSLATMPAKFWSLIEKKSPGLIRKKISIHIDDKEKRNYKFNAAQDLIHHLFLNGGSQQLKEAFEPYLDIGLMPIIEIISNSKYEKESDIFEYSLREEFYNIFIPYAEHLNILNEMQKEIMVAASFSWLMKYKASTYTGNNEKHYELWAEKVLMISDIKLIKKYLDLNKNDILNKELKEKIETIFNLRKLEEIIPEKQFQHRSRIKL